MKLYIVENGYTGNGSVECSVIAENEERAIELAREEYKKHAKELYYISDYYNNLYATCLCENTSEEYVSGISD